MLKVSLVPWNLKGYIQVVISGILRCVNQELDFKYFSFKFCHEIHFL